MSQLAVDIYSPGLAGEAGSLVDKLVAERVAFAAAGLRAVQELGP